VRLAAFTFGLALAALAAPASALSCRPWTPVDAYLAAANASARYAVVQGHLKFDERRLPKVNWDRQGDTPPRTEIPARFTGKMLSRSGFDRPFSADVTLEVLCYGPWCASAVNGGDYLAFLEERGGRHVLQVNPCGGFGFSVNSRKVQRQILACHRGQSCKGSAD
jgi:hypothetical protein